MTDEQKQYEDDLKERQRQHLENVKRNTQPVSFPMNTQPFVPAWKPCLHDACTSCHGTGIKFDGSSCVHCLYCDCPKCGTFAWNAVSPPPSIDIKYQT